MRPIAPTCVCLALLLLTGCKRDAAAPIASGQLFRDAVDGPTATDSARGSLARAQILAELEPNDAPTLAQAVPALVIVEGTLQAAGVPDAGLAPPIAKAPRKGRKPALLLVDADWFRLPAPPPGQQVQVDLRSGPACAELELYDDTGLAVRRTAKWWKGTRPVLPALGAGARASLVRVVCRGVAGAGGAYQLAVSTRITQPGEEVEPNDVADPAVLAVGLGMTQQGTLAPENDVDHVILDLSGQLGGEAFALSIAGLPDLDLQVELLDPATQQVLLRRRSGKGGAVLVPNLDVGRTGDRPLVRIKAVAGQQPDVPYAVGIQTWLPPGCARQADCAGAIPLEREPNDDAGRAMDLPLVAARAPDPGTTAVASGLLDGPGDVDWWRIPAPAEGGVALLVLRGPGALGMALGTGEVGVRLEAAPGVPLATVGGLVAAGGSLLVSVAAAKDGSSRTEAYQLAISWQPAGLFETEAGDETRGAGLYSPAHALLEDARSLGILQRQGALVPAGDRDGYGVDLSARPEPSGWQLACQGDGAPGLRCALQDAAGRAVIALAAPLDGFATVPVVLLPGRYRVLVSAESPRPSPRAYAVQLREDASVLALPAGATPVDAPLAVTP